VVGVATAEGRAAACPPLEGSADIADGGAAGGGDDEAPAHPPSAHPKSITFASRRTSVSIRAVSSSVTIPARRARGVSLAFSKVSYKIAADGGVREARRNESRWLWIIKSGR